MDFFGLRLLAAFEMQARGFNWSNQFGPMRGRGRARRAAARRRSRRR